jgi:hypothetical protein
MLMAMCVLCVGLFVPSAWAQDEQPIGRDSNFVSKLHDVTLANGYTDQIKEIARTGKVSYVEVYRLRASYGSTKQYQGFSDEILEQMIRLSFDLKNELDTVKAQEIAHSFKTLVFNHLANLEVLILAKSISEADVRLGNSLFYEKMEKLVYDHILKSGTGKTAEQPYRVLTFGEENILIKRLGKGSLVDSKLWEEEGDRFLNIHDFRNKDKELVMRMMVDVSTPIQQTRESQKDEVALRKRIRKF